MLAQFGKLLRALASGKDPASLPAPTEVIPTIELAKPPDDWAWSGDIYLYGGYASEAAAAGSPSNVALYNPLSSSAIVTIEEITLRQAANYAFLFMADNADVSLYDSDGYEFARDPRVQFTTGGTNYGRPSTCKVLSDQAAVGGQRITMLAPIMEDAGNNFMFKENMGLVLTPGSAIIATNNTNNIAINVSFIWRERVLNKEELRGIDPRIMY